MGSWLCCFPGLSSALAENPCSIQMNQTSQLLPNSSLATRLVSEGTQPFVEVKCTGKGSGSLRLSVNGKDSKVYGGFAQIRLIGASGIFAVSSSEFTAGSLSVPYSLLLDEGGAGKVMYQVQVSASDRRLLQAASDYSVAVIAELLP